MAQHSSVMISSTAIDLPYHRQLLLDGCLRQGFFPLLMEQLPASDDGAIAVSLEMVDEADIYLGILGSRYGHVPAGHDISITEMEYRRAFQRRIPCLMFFMHLDHPTTGPDADTGEKAKKLEALKRVITDRHVVNFFHSAEDLRALAINSLSHHRTRAPAALYDVSEIPCPPEPYIAQPYTLLQTRELIGRNVELDLLTAWASRQREDLGFAHLFVVLALGGEGKSALTWHWFTVIAPHIAEPFAGRMWWSFYESDTSFESFVTRTLVYVSGRSESAVRESTLSERESQLLSILDRQRYLLVLDGFERVLNAYGGRKSWQSAEGELDRKGGEARSGLRKTSDPRMGAFLRKLRQIRATGVLVSTRLYPAELETVTGKPFPEVSSYELSGLSDEDALALWRAFEVAGSREALLPMFNSVGNHALAIQALASEIAHDRRAPGDFDRWCREHPDFNPFGLPLQQSQNHVLAFALEVLEERGRTVLYTIASFQNPATYDTLTTLLVGDDKPFPDEASLDTTLRELEDRGLLGWNRRANLYDLHPIVRGVIWSSLPDGVKRALQQEIAAHLEALLPQGHVEKIERLEDLTAAIELYGTLIDLERYDDANYVMNKKLYGPLLQIGAYTEVVELLERLFPQGLDTPLPFANPAVRANILFALAVAYDLSGQPGRAVSFHQRSYLVYRQMRKLRGAVGVMKDAADSLLLCGRLIEAETAARWALNISTAHGDSQHQIISLYCLGNILAARGLVPEAKDNLSQALHIATTTSERTIVGAVCAHLAQLELRSGNFQHASDLADRALEHARDADVRDLIRAKRLLGCSALDHYLDAKKSAQASESLNEALVRARETRLVEEELPVLVGLAELRRRQGNLLAAHELLEDVWELAERGPYLMFHADAKNVLAQMERDAGNHLAAVQAATEAFRLSWCDGPPYMYHWGLKASQVHLAALGLAARGESRCWRYRNLGKSSQLRRSSEWQWARRRVGRAGCGSQPAIWPAALGIRSTSG